MKTILIALAATIGIMSVTLPASAGYIDPNASWREQAFQHGD